MQSSIEPKAKTQRAQAAQRDQKRDKPEHGRKAKREQKRSY